MREGVEWVQASPELVLSRGPGGHGRADRSHYRGLLLCRVAVLLQDVPAINQPARSPWYDNARVQGL